MYLVLYIKITSGSLLSIEIVILMLIISQTVPGICVETIGCGGLGGVNDWHAMQFSISSSTTRYS